MRRFNFRRRDTKKLLAKAQRRIVKINRFLKACGIDKRAVLMDAGEAMWRTGYPGDVP